MPATFTAFIDESGDDGFSYDRGGSSWFVMSAVVVRKLVEIPVCKLLDRVRITLNKPAKKPLHFRDLRHEQKLPFLAEIVQADLRIMSVLVHKRSIGEPAVFQSEPHRFYFYITRYLLERVSWFCRDHRPSNDTGDGTVDAVFSNRSSLPYDKLCGYIRTLQDLNPDVADVRLAPGIIRDDQIHSFSSGKRMGLQIADAIAHSFFRAVEPTGYGFREDRYARMLKPVVYHRKGNYRSYGVKFFPRQAEELKQGEEYLRWARPGKNTNKKAGPGPQEPAPRGAAALAGDLR